MVQSNTLLREIPAQSDEISNDAGQSGAEKIHEQVYQQLRWAIISGQLDPGRSLSVRSLAADFGVSTMPAREAIRRLVALGALEVTPTRRVTVARMSMDKFRELTEARLALEPAIAVRAMAAVQDDAVARNLLVAELKEIDARIDRAIGASDSATYARTNCEFHYRLYEAANTPVYLALVESLWLQIGPFMRALVKRLGDTLPVDQHKLAIEAIVNGDAAMLESTLRRDISDSLAYSAPSDFEAFSA